jgi:hypothetical protein
MSCPVVPSLTRNTVEEQEESGAVLRFVEIRVTVIAESGTNEAAV